MTISTHNPRAFDQYDEAVLARLMRDSAQETHDEMMRRHRRFERLWRTTPPDEPKRPKLGDLISAYAATVAEFSANEVADAIKSPRPSVAPQLARLVKAGVLVVASKRGARHFRYRLAPPSLIQTPPASAHGRNAKPASGQKSGV